MPRALPSSSARDVLPFTSIAWAATATLAQATDTRQNWAHLAELAVLSVPAVHGHCRQQR
eukprot:2134788-Amphidinium_carterae.2